MCEAISINGSTVFICRGKKRYPEKMCRFCRQRTTSLLCDFEVGLGKRGTGGDFIAGTKTCDAEMCSICATKFGDQDICPDHVAAIQQAPLFGETVAISANEAHARQVLAGAYPNAPCLLTPLQRELLKVLLFHQGAQRAIPLRDLMGKLSRATGKSATEREIKDAARGLVVDFKVRIGASRNAQPGYYLITTAEEARDTAAPYISEIKKLAQRVKVILDPHDLAELEGQSIFTDPDPKEAA